MKHNMDLELRPFADINLEDSFFDSLKAAYPEFPQWFAKKAGQGEKAYVSCFEDGRVADFLYMKIETEAVEDVVPVMPAKRRLKVGTFKLLSRGTRRGEQMMEIVMKRAKEEKVEEIYATIFPTEELKSLVRLFEKYGFRHVGVKVHPGSVAEWVMAKSVGMKVLMSIKPEFVAEILAGRKLVEYRKRIPKNGQVKQVLIYASHPVKRVVAEFTIGGFLEGTPAEVWAETRKVSGITKEYFDEYFKGKEVAYAIRIKDLRINETPVMLPEGMRAPQSYCYVGEEF